MGRFELVRRIGAGGMAEIFLARLPGPAGFSKTVVIKRILPRLNQDPLMVRMFIEEARIAAAADHDNIARVYELGRTQAGHYFMVMEYIDGTDLEILLRDAAQRELKVPTWFSVHAVTEILEALSFVHGLCDEQGQPRNVIHRDATPSNIFISNLGQVKLSDFGVADFAGKSPTTQAGQLKGKLAYMSPEQLRALSLDARADVFSMGVVLWEALTQERLFGHLSEVRAMMAICEPERAAPSSHSPGLPPALDSICAKALALDRDDRYDSAEAFQTDLLTVLHELHGPVRPTDVRNVLEQLAGRKQPEPETMNPGPAPAQDKSFLVLINDFSPAPDEAEPAELDPGLETIKSEGHLLPESVLESLPSYQAIQQPYVDAESFGSSDDDLMETINEEPALAIEIADLQAQMAAQAAKKTPAPKAILAEDIALEGSISGKGSRPHFRPDALPAPTDDLEPNFWIRNAPGQPPQRATWSQVVLRARAATEAEEGLEVSADGKDFASLPELGRITGQDLSFELEPPSNVTIVGSLSKKSLTRVLSHLALDHATGVLSVAGAQDGTWYELEIHQGRATRLLSPMAETQLPKILVARGVEARQVDRMCYRALAERRPLRELAQNSRWAELSEDLLLQTRLTLLYPWTEGDYTFNADLTRPQPHGSHRGSLLARLPDLVAAAMNTEHLQSRLHDSMHRTLSPQPRLFTAQALFSAHQRTIISGLMDAPLSSMPKADSERYKAVLACAYVLTEAELVS